MTRLTQMIGLAAVLAVIAAGVGYFSVSPVYRHFPEGHALVKLSISHGGERKVECVRRTAKELAKLAPNMRKAELCQRERVPLKLEIVLDGKLLYSAMLPPTGIAGDGPSHAYQRFAIPAGEHSVDLKLRDSRDQEGFDHIAQKSLRLAEGDSVAIDFRNASEGFVLK